MLQLCFKRVRDMNSDVDAEVFASFIEGIDSPNEVLIMHFQIALTLYGCSIYIRLRIISSAILVTRNPSAIFIENYCRNG
jgi:hypothetical protein